MKEKIKDGYTNTSYRDNNVFYQEKKHNGWNHQIDYTIFKDLDFIPKLIENTPNSVSWQWIDNKKNVWDEYTIREVAKNLKKFHNSKLQLPPKNLTQRYENYRRILKEKGIDTKEVWEFKDRVNDILNNARDLWPVHNDLYGSNVMTSVDNKIYFVDWEYATMGDKHFDLAFFIVASIHNEEREKWFLDEYQDYSEEQYTKYKMVICYFIIIWAYSLDKMPIDINYWLKRINDEWNNYHYKKQNNLFKN
ncbi:aminoglycoside phosphotransferase family protein [[Mycoplasma] gypis]|uniref:Aminoglycoside phosphotransferase family protein n=1 Tax=[Mycoplasma] gypis TaxID=92404 RepID=A0ABZ2RTY5_9BACT|nr:aminoglycoside phosphotransferase family protein [[Mycoplasma] gypis]MBN0919122.1 phosphotransferase [[Mycoplasma] gypis]